MAIPLRPAHETKHVPVLRYPFRDILFDLAQRDNGDTNGTGLWLGAQCLSFYLADHLKHRGLPGPGSSPGADRPRVIELGSGIGLSALVLASMDWDVLATDLQDVISAVLTSNVSRNRTHLPPSSGAIEVRVLDWTVPPDHWVWDNPNRIASQNVENVTETGIQNSCLAPPFDLIISSDTLYAADLVTPLLRALHALCKISIASSPEARSPPIYLCLERRDPSLIDRALSEARDAWGFTTERVPHKKLTKSMEKGGARWLKDEWDGVELWKLSLRI